MSNYMSGFSGKEVDERLGFIPTIVELLKKGLTSEHISNDAITSEKIKNGSVNTSKLVDAAVTDDKIADETISKGKLNEDVISLITSNKFDGVVESQAIDEYEFPVVNGTLIYKLVDEGIVDDFGGLLLVGAWYNGGVKLVTMYQTKIIISTGEILTRRTTETSGTKPVSWSEWESKYLDKEVADQILVGKKISNGGEIFNDYKNNSASGYHSHAEGNFTEAMGKNTHAEGNSTTAIIDNSHTEGTNTLTEARAYTITNTDGGTFIINAIEINYSTENNYIFAQGNDGIYIAISPEDKEIFDSFEYIYIGYNTKIPRSYFLYEGTNNGRYTTNSDVDITNYHIYFACEIYDDFDPYNFHEDYTTIKCISIPTYIQFTENTNLISDGIENGMFISLLTENYKYIAKILNVTNENTITFNTNHGSTKITLESGVITPGIQVMIDGGAYGDQSYIFPSNIDISSHAEGSNTKAYVHGHAEGRESEARGHASHAEGRNTIAHGEYSHTEGYYSITKESVAHAEGYYTVAAGGHSHAEGRETQTTAENAHAEGRGSIASGLNSHAEGRETQAIGENSHAEGYQTKAHATQSHAEGQRTEAIGILSHTEGNKSRALSEGSHAEGYFTTAEGIYSHAEGYNSKTAADYAHSEGSSNTASGAASHAEGSVNTASGEISHAEGGGNTASAKAAHAEGYLTTASGAQSHSEGRSTKAIGSCSHAEGLETQANGDNAHTEGYKTIAKAGNSHAEGDRTIASGANQHVQGKFNLEDSTKAHIVGWGTSDKDRKNIHTIDTNGNAYYAGDMESSSVVIRSSTPGSNKKFKLTIDDSGTISVSEA